MSEILKENTLLMWAMKKSDLDAEVIELVKKGATKKQILLAIKKAAFLKILEMNMLLEDESKDGTV